MVENNGKKKRRIAHRRLWYIFWRWYSDEFSLGIWEGENVKYACFLQVVHLLIKVWASLWNMKWGTRHTDVTEGERLRRREDRRDRERERREGEGICCRFPTLTTSQSVSEARSARLRRLGSWCTNKGFKSQCAEAVLRGAKQRQTDSERERERWSGGGGGGWGSQRGAEREKVKKILAVSVQVLIPGNDWANSSPYRPIGGGLREPYCRALRIYNHMCLKKNNVPIYNFLFTFPSIVLLKEGRRPVCDQFVTTVSGFRVIFVISDVTNNLALGWLTLLRLWHGSVFLLAYLLILPRCFCRQSKRWFTHLTANCQLIWYISPTELHSHLWCHSSSLWGRVYLCYMHYSDQPKH